jgi:1-phosphofructokinase family hexose kinase
MIITVALNPALDQTVEVEHFSLADTNRVLAMRSDVGGKGINVARALKEIGLEPLATGFAPGVRGRQIVDQLEDAGIGCDFVYVPGEVRTNITILDRATHTHTQLALPGPQMEPLEASHLVERIRRRVRPGAWLVLAGSIPPPGDAGIYAELITIANERGAQTVLDADGPIVERVLAAGAHPTVLKVNDHELSRLAHLNIETDDEVLQAAHDMQRRGVPNIVVTMGGEGALAVTAEGDFHVRPPHVEVVSAVGAGDAFTGGLICGLVREQGWQRALTLAAAAGSAACLMPGTSIFKAPDVWRLRLEAAAERIPIAIGVR